MCTTFFVHRALVGGVGGGSVMNIYENYPVGTANPTGPNRFFGSLVAYITTYLSIPQPSTIGQTAQVMICPSHWRKIPGGASYSAPVSCPVPYYIKQWIHQEPSDDSGTSTAISPLAVTYPFGRPNTVSSPPAPTPLPDGSAPTHKISEIPRAADQWAITDDDKVINGGGTYAAWLPAEPVHGYASSKPVRDFMFYDAHVASQKRDAKGNP